MGGRRWKYVAEIDGSGAFKRNSVRALSLHTPQAPLDIGAGLGILMSKKNPSLASSFAFLSCGYVLSSYREVKSGVLHTLNRARFCVAVESFLRTGRAPALQEGNMNENIFSFPWKEMPVVLGSRFKDAFQYPSAYVAIKPLF